MLGEKLDISCESVNDHDDIDIYLSPKFSSMGPIVSMAIRSMDSRENKTNGEAQTALWVASIF